MKLRRLSNQLGKKQIAIAVASEFPSRLFKNTQNVMKLGVEGWLRLIKAGRVCPQEIDWLLCHYSSHFFRGQIVELLEQAGCMIPEEKWFTNFYSRGNTGGVSIYLILEGFCNSDKLQSAQKIFCFVPESRSFTTAYMMLTAVENTNKPMIYQISNFLDVPEASTLESVKPEQPNSPQAYLLRELVWIWLTSALPEIATGIM
ncbi:hypothetical protein [Microcoleus sp. D2_18a_B4]|uniref:hypothetical protein n=1 Tax=Microcoleus sp. D2_18a_B4 TaxID=3055329 RepID=UPI002FD2D1B1